MVTIDDIRNNSPDDSLDGSEILLLDNGPGGATKAAVLDKYSASSGVDFASYLKGYIEALGFNLSSGQTLSLNSIDIKDVCKGYIEANGLALATGKTITIATADIRDVIRDYIEANGLEIAAGEPLTIGGVPVGTSSDSYWTIDGDGHISYGDVVDLHHIGVANLEAIDKIVASSATIVDVFIYDTSKDSDGGAWREKCSDKSWYQETLNTATRGATRKFPAKALIVATTSQVIIYDMDKADIPMWMVFNGSTYYYVHGTNITSVFAVNGKLWVSGNETTSDYATAGLRYVDFIIDNGGKYATTTHRGTYNKSILYRNSNVSDVSKQDLSAIVNVRCNAVTAKVLQNAPIDDTTGLPIATVLVATNGGVSIIKTDGTVVDITCSNASYTYSYLASFDSNNGLWLTLGASNYSNYSYVYYFSAHPTADDVITLHSKTGSSKNADGMFSTYTTYGDRVLLPASVFAMPKAMYAGRFFGYNVGAVQGLALLSDDRESVANITTTYNTGWMPGDIKGCWLSSNDDTNLDGTELVTNGDFSSASDWTLNTGYSIPGGELVATAVGNGIKAVNTGTVVSGKTYVVSFDVTNFSAGLVTILLGTQAGSYVGANGSYTQTIVANGTSINIGCAGAATTLNVDNVSVVEADADRSVHKNGLTVNGTITKSAVATGAESMAYSGFSAINNLTAASNSDWDDLGTGAAYLSCWFKSAGNSAIETLLDIGDSGATKELGIALAADGKVNFSDYGATAAVDTTSSLAYDNGLWHKIDAVRVSSTSRALYIDGVLVTSNTTDAGTISDAGNLYLYIGVLASSGSTYAAETSSIALAKISATAPTAEQIKKMYEDEKYIFQENAQCCLSGSNSIYALDYDEDTDKLYVATYEGVDVLSGLTRVETIDDSGTMTNIRTTKVSASNGAVAIRNNAEAYFYEPEANIREELAEAKAKELPNVGISLNEDGETEHANKEKFKDDVEFEVDVEIAGILTANRNFAISDNPKYPDVSKTDAGGVAKIFNSGSGTASAASSVDIVLKVIDDTYFTATKIREKFTALIIANTTGGITTSRGSQILQISGSVVAGDWTDLTVDVISTTVKGYISAQTWAISLDGTAPGTILLTTTITNSHPSSGHTLTTTIYGDAVYSGHN